MPNEELNAIDRLRALVQVPSKSGRDNVSTNDLRELLAALDDAEADCQAVTSELRDFRRLERQRAGEEELAAARIAGARDMRARAARTVCAHDDCDKPACHARRIRALPLRPRVDADDLPVEVHALISSARALTQLDLGEYDDDERSGPGNPRYRFRDAFYRLVDDIAAFDQARESEVEP